MKKFVVYHKEGCDKWYLKNLDFFHTDNINEAMTFTYAEAKEQCEKMNRAFFTNINKVGRAKK